MQLDFERFPTFLLNSYKVLLLLSYLRMPARPKIMPTALLPVRLVAGVPALAGATMRHRAQAGTTLRALGAFSSKCTFQSSFAKIIRG